MIIMIIIILIVIYIYIYIWREREREREMHTHTHISTTKVLANFRPGNHGGPDAVVIDPQQWMAMMMYQGLCVHLK